MWPAVYFPDVYYTPAYFGGPAPDPDPGDDGDGSSSSSSGGVDAAEVVFVPAFWDPF